MKIASLAAAALLLAACSAEVPVEKTPAPAPAPAPAPTPAPAPAAAKPYPMDTCVVSGEKLGGMGDPVVYMHEGTEVRFCCSNCIKDFKKDPAKYLAILEAARKK